MSIVIEESSGTEPTTKTNSLTTFSYKPGFTWIWVQAEELLTETGAELGSSVLLGQNARPTCPLVKVGLHCDLWYFRIQEFIGGKIRI